MSSFQHTFLQVFSDIKGENSVILHCDQSEGMNGYVSAQEQHVAACCDACYWEYLWNLELLKSLETVLLNCKKTEEKRELPSAQEYNSCNFHIKSRVSGKEKKKGIRSPVHFVVEETMSYLWSQQDGHRKFCQGRECDISYENKSSQTVQSIKTNLLLQLLSLRSKQLVRL